MCENSVAPWQQLQVVGRIHYNVVGGQLQLAANISLQEVI